MELVDEIISCTEFGRLERPRCRKKAYINKLKRNDDKKNSRNLNVSWLLGQQIELKRHSSNRLHRWGLH